MDTDLIALKLKRHKLMAKFKGDDEEEEEEEEVIRSLNDLPDKILKHILSFLEMKCAVRTSVLCKRWEYMWTSLPDLEFIELDRTNERNILFMNFVERALLLHDASPIRKFSLSFVLCKDEDISRVKTWIYAAVKRNAKEFKIYCKGVDGNLFPYCLFSSATIQVLKISALYEILIKLPSEIFLPRLKILILKNVNFTDYCLANLLFASPVLEELVIDTCKWDEIRYELIISAPKLCCLTIDESYEEFLKGQLSVNSATILAPLLKKFNYKGGFIKPYSFCSSSICSATFDFHDYMDEDQIDIDNLDKVLRSVQLVEYLNLSTSFYEAMSRATLPVFENLTTLEIPDKPVDLSCKELKMLLNKCPRLETLIFLKGISRYCGLDCLLDSKFAFLLSTIKSIMIGAYKGDFTESFTVKFLLENVTSLATMKILCSEIKVVSSRKFLESFLSAMPRASKSCKLDLHFD